MKKVLASSVFLLALFSCHSFARDTKPLTYAERDERIISLLEAQAFDELDDMLVRTEKVYEKDPLTERDMDLSFDAFYRANPKLEPLLTKWIKAKPESAVAYTARGVYFTNLGWATRGHKSIDKTNGSQLDGMTASFRKALMDFEKAHSLNKNMLHPVSYQIEILMHYGSRQDKIRQLYEEALKINPLSLTARWRFITAILPRWGGTIEEVEAEVVAARSYMERNKALEILNGRVAAERGDQDRLSGNFPRAEIDYREAQQFGKHWYYSGMWGEALHYGKHYDESNEILATALSLRPNYPRVLFLMGMNEYKLKRIDKAIALFTKVIEDNPYDHKTLDLRGDCNMRQGQIALAVADFDEAVRLEPTNQEYLIDQKRAWQMLLAQPK